MSDDYSKALGEMSLSRLQARPTVQYAVRQLRDRIPKELIEAYRTQGALIFDSFDEYRRQLGEGLLTDKEWHAAVEKLTEVE